MKLEIINTADGSHTLFAPELNEHYHSVHGSISESIHIFINAGFCNCKSDLVNVLEVGLGTGLNALLTCIGSQTRKCRVNYFALEPFPVEEKIWKLLNYPQMLDNHEASSLFRQIHTAGWNCPSKISETFLLEKINSGIFEAELSDRTFDLVYFDAFAPAVQPELWRQDIFSKLFRACKPGAILVTYSAKGDVRRRLQRAGFRIERLPGPFGKREFLRGWVD